MGKTSRKNSATNYKQITKLRSQSSVSLLGNGRRISVNYNNLMMIQNDFELRNLARSSSLASLGNWTGVVLANEVLPTETKSWYVKVNVI